MKNILYIGCTEVGQTSHERLAAMRDLGHSVVEINACTPLNPLQRLWQKAALEAGLFYDPQRLNRAIKAYLRRAPVDLLWVDKGTRIKASTLRWIKRHRPDTVLVHFNPDDPFGQYKKGWDVFLEAIPYYDVHFVARPQNVEEFAARGARRVLPYDRSFSKQLHRPLPLTPEEARTYGAPVGFVGSHAPDRAAMIAFLIARGIPVAVYGDGWTKREHWERIAPHYRGPSRFGEEYAKIINGMGIALHFLRRENRDEQDSRTFEIPACGAFMLAERSPKHEELFQENIEAVFFDTEEDLLEKVRYFLEHPERAREIAAAGRQRCLESGYDHHNRIKAMLHTVLNGQSEY